ncbi:hypothetical protein D3C85_1897210 [compost metagenome]
MVEPVGYPFPIALDHPSGVAYHRTIAWHLTENNRIGADIAIIADLERSQYFCAGANDNIVAYGRMAFSFFFTRSP